MSEVDRSDRRARRRVGKSDPIDAIAAVRAVQSGAATFEGAYRAGGRRPRVAVTRRGAVKARIAALSQLHGLVATAPEQLRGQLAGPSAVALLHACSG